MRSVRVAAGAARRPLRGALGLTCLGVLGVLAACAPVQVVEVQTDPPGAAIFRIDAAGRTRIGTAPVRFTAHAETPFRVRAELPDHAPVEGEVPGRDVQAFLELHLSPRGALLDDRLLLRFLLIHGPQDLAALRKRAPELLGPRGQAAAKRLLAQREIRALKPRGARAGTSGDAAAPDSALSAGAILDVTAIGFRRLESRLSPGATLEQLLVSRLALYRRWRRAARLLDGPDRDGGR